MFTNVLPSSSANREENSITITVTDNGIGLPQDRERILDPYVTPREKGTGLGLAIVKRLSDLLELRLDVRSDVGKGSTFSVSLPAIDDAALCEDAELVGEPGHVTGGSGLVILIEDDVNVANAWGHLLEAEGYRVATAASATEAKALMNYVDETPALLISDFHLLDGSTGVEAVSAIRDNYNASIPAFIVSGDTSKVVKDARLLDNCTLMCKPIDTNRLLAAARHAVNTGDVPLD